MDFNRISSFETPNEIWICSKSLMKYETLDLDELTGSLVTYELNLQEKEEDSKKKKNTTLKSIK